MRKFYLLIITVLILSGTYAQERSQVFPNPNQEVRLIKCYPNPAVSFINFEFQQTPDKNVQLQIINFLGRKVYELNAISSKNVMVSLNEFYRGIYIFQLRDSKGKLIDSGKFQVSR
jgi:hypothetical protein